MYGLLWLPYPTEKTKRRRYCGSNLKIRRCTKRKQLFVKVDQVYFERVFYLKDIMKSLVPSLCMIPSCDVIAIYDKLYIWMAETRNNHVK